MKKLLTAFTAIAFLASCQKEPDFTDPANPSVIATAPTGLLTRVVEGDGTDSSVYSFSYNAAGKLVQYNYGDAGYSSVNKYVRNAGGIITQTVFISPDLLALGIDSTVTNVFFNAGSSRYTHTRSDVAAGGATYSDSTAFAYDASGHLASALVYQKTSPLPFVPSSRTDYTYAGENVVTEKSYSYNSATSAFVLEGTLTYTYDAKTNPLTLGAEAVIVGFTTFSGPNNASGLTYTGATNSVNDYTQAYNYTYNSAGKPTGGTILENPGAVTYQMRYYYN